MAEQAAPAVRQQYLWIRLDFNQDEGLDVAVVLVLVLVLVIVWGLVLFFLNGHELSHFHNNVFQLGSSLITSAAMPLYRNIRCISNPRRRPISRKIDEHMAPQLRSYIAASTEKDDAQFESLNIP